MIAERPIESKVQGVTVQRAGECLERVSSLAIEVRLLSSSATAEVVEGTLRAGQRLTLTPLEGAVETYYILSGELSTPDGETLRAGDHFVVQSLSAVTTFSALSEVRFLFVSSVPQFHEISEEIRQLRELAIEVELKDGYTSDHCYRIQRLSYATGEQLGLSAERLHRLDYGAYFHDIGKTKVPEEILNKPGKLTPEEWRVIEQHPQFGREALGGTYPSIAGKIVEQHHERFDGSGYPYGLKGDEILTEAYIVAVADTFDAMTTDRPYRKALSAETAFAEIRKFADVHYPVEVVEAFFNAVTQLAVSGRGT